MQKVKISCYIRKYKNCRWENIELYEPQRHNAAARGTQRRAQKRSYK